MITEKYKKMYDLFISFYKDKHVNPWHEINEEELNNIYDKIVLEQNIVDDYSFNYLMNYVIKRLGGVLDAHTQYSVMQRIPINFKMFGKEIIVNFPDDLKGLNLVSINGVLIDVIIDELDDVIAYGTEGKRKYEIEKALFNKQRLFSLPSLRGANILIMNFKDSNGNIYVKKFKKDEQYLESEMFDAEKYLFGNPGTFNIFGNKLVITHSSVQNRFKEKIENMVEELKQLDLSSIDTIIVDIRGNTGGNSAINKCLMDFLENCNKKLICLTDYRVFSGGRYALINLIELGAITIGTGISTPLNCYGNSGWIKHNGYTFASSTCFLAPNVGVAAFSKEDYSLKVTKDVTIPKFFKPDIFVEQSKEDYINGVDTVMAYAFKYADQIKFKKK